MNCQNMLTSFFQKNKSQFYLACLLCVSHLSYAQSLEALSERVDQLIQKKLPRSTVGIYITDAQTGQVVLSRNEDKLLAPASNMKLFTAAAALYYLKPEYRFLTTLSQKGDDFYITFTGSPSLNVEDLNALWAFLKKEEITTIKGNIILDTSHFEPPNYPSGASYDDLGWYYSAPSSAVILSENTVGYELISAKELGQLVHIKPKSSENGIRVLNQVTTVSAENAKNHCTFNIEMKPDNTLKLFGCLSQREETRTYQLAVPNPELYAKFLIKKALAALSIRLKGDIKTGKTPFDAKELIQLQSKPLIDLLTHMLEESDNLYADSITKQLGFSLTGQGTYKQGAYAIKKILNDYLKLDILSIKLFDGMGSRYNLVTVRELVVLLTKLYQDEHIGPIFVRSLPQSGVSGTLKDRMNKPPLQRKVIAKTGTMHDMSALSGYIFDVNGHSYIFSIVINGVNTHISAAKALEEDILMELVGGSQDKPVL